MTELNPEGIAVLTADGEPVGTLTAVGSSNGGDVVVHVHLEKPVTGLLAVAVPREQLQEIL